jgi:hypothetical protein
VALVRTDVSEEPGASFIRVTKICELGTTQAATSNRRTLRTFFIVTAVKTSNLTYCCGVLKTLLDYCSSIIRTATIFVALASGIHILPTPRCDFFFSLFHLTLSFQIVCRSVSFCGSFVSVCCPNIYTYILVCAVSVIYWAGFLRCMRQAKISAMRCHDNLNITSAMPIPR